MASRAHRRTRLAREIRDTARDVGTAAASRAASAASKSPIPSAATGGAAAGAAEKLIHKVGDVIRGRGARQAGREAVERAKAKGKVSTVHPGRLGRDVRLGRPLSQRSKEALSGASPRTKKRLEIGRKTQAASKAVGVAMDIVAHSDVRERMETLLEALGGPRYGLKPDNVATRPQGLLAKLNQGPPSAHREREWWATVQKGANKRSKATIKRAFNLKGLGQGGPGMTTG